MSDLNKIFISGRLGGDPEGRETKTGLKMAVFSVATSRRSKEHGEQTEWHRVVTWGKQSESCLAYLKKGRSVVVEGMLKTRKYPGKDGVERVSVEVHAHEVTFLGGSKRNSGVEEEAGTGVMDVSEVEMLDDSELRIGAAESEMTTDCQLSRDSGLVEDLESPLAV